MEGAAHQEEAALAIKCEIEKLGARFDEAVSDSTRNLFAAHLDVNRATVETYDLAYGTHERNRLDVFTEGGGNLPIVLFVHGGGFTAGDKRSTDHFYGNVGRYFASRGFLAATMNYRLAPADTWPSGLEDVAAAVSWLSRNASVYGGDPSRIGLLGQSAGCCHIAGYLFGDHGASRFIQNVRACALLSGLYTVKPPLSPGQQAYFGTDVAQYPERSPMMHVARSATPLLLTVAQFDPPRIAQQTLEFAGALTSSRGACPRLLWLAGHNHVSSALSLGSAQRDVGELLVDYFSQHLAPTGN
jgi:dipeptidyl aminopeptidase/acylaminoacyl peptidase